jgi:hypothetical protein
MDSTNVESDSPPPAPPVPEGVGGGEPVAFRVVSWHVARGGNPIALSRELRELAGEVASPELFAGICEWALRTARQSALGLIRGEVIKLNAQRRALHARAVQPHQPRGSEAWLNVHAESMTDDDEHARNLALPN